MSVSKTTRSTSEQIFNKILISEYFKSVSHSKIFFSVKKMEEIKSLINGLSQEELKVLTEEIHQKQNAKRGKIVEMSSEVVDSNPYSRLMALKRLLLLVLERFCIV